MRHALVVLAAGLAAALALAGCSKSKSNAGSTGAGTTAGSGGCGLRTCQSAGANCGPIGDGCGGTLDCGTCPETEFCGGAGPSQCGGHACTPTTCAAAGATCGIIADGCGGTLSCGSCGQGEFCGGAGANHCGNGTFADGGSATCQPRSCAGLGANCGPVGDGCGGLLQCGSCAQGEVCGGGGPSVCGLARTPDGGPVCTNLCLQQQVCDGGSTSVSGKVYAPNGQDPLYGALVFVPNGAVQPFQPGIACLSCDAEVTGSPLVATTTGPDGSFTLTNMPVGQNIPLVIQLGRWRRQVTVSNVPACGNTSLPATLTRLPRNQGEGDIPLTAMVTGDVDALECVLRKIGIDDAEFTNPGGTGRVQLFTAAGDGGGSQIDGSTPTSTALVDAPATLAKYDLSLFACEGYQNDKPDSELTNLLNYANGGGRVFATHFSYTWLYKPTTWSGAAFWDPNHDRGTSTRGTVDTSFPKGQAFSQWLDAVGASTSPGSNQITIDQWRWDVDAVKPGAQSWITIDGGSAVEHLTFNTPLGAAPQDQCGRVLFSDFHVTDAPSTKGTNFPAECSGGGLSAQEHVLEFMLFDLASCISPDNTAGCIPRSCAEVGANCGPIGDGCGGLLQCGSCPSGQSCGGAGTPSVCGTPACKPRSCAEQGLQCGQAGDGCGGVVDCGSCAAGETCGGGGTPSVCGKPACTATTCAAQGAECGPIADGCGGVLDCGTCADGSACGGGGPNLCSHFR